MSCPNSAYEQEYWRKFVVPEIETFLDKFIKCRAVQKRQIKIVVFEIKIDALEGEVELWKSVFWQCRFIRLLFPLENVRNVLRDIEALTYWLNGPKL